MCIATSASGKRKSQSFDDFLSVLTVSGNVVDVCDIPTTNRDAGRWRLALQRGLDWGRGSLQPFGPRESARPYESENGAPHMQKGRGDLAAALLVVRLREA
jgi:hypothetical protein